MTGEEIGPIVRARIKEQGLTISSVGRRFAKITDQAPESGIRAVRRLANGAAKNPNYETIVALALAVGVTTAEMVTPPGESDPMGPLAEGRDRPEPGRGDPRMHGAGGPR